MKHITDDINFFRKTAHWSTCIVRATQSNCCGDLDFLFLNHAPQQPSAECIDYNI